ncbi:hypothetical protein J3R30DRAFT_3421357 [Lentinula aciculospora]|uniref:Carbohydrate-binding module family 50 protein n=1 Tax=Lentinula aciculospora TaxID=153920 RepID=A0A9W9AW47_9AGAR|nr:hypothetical protein J3R30DRAFT_3421357 [Lentinula aciculospora]
MSRFTQYAEDASRLPEGFQRIAYDADTEQYTFKDRNGALYRSAPGESYGKLIPVSDGKAEAWRYNDGEHEHKRPQISTSNLPAPKSFHDILPPQAIASAGSYSPTSSNSDSSESLFSLSPRSRFIEAARRSTMPKMQGVVHNLRRSVTSSKKNHARAPPTVPEKDADMRERVALLRSQSVMSRSSVMTTQSSVTMLTLVEEKRV